MSKTIVESVRAPMWAIERLGRDNSEVLHFGRHRIALSDIASVAAEQEAARPISGLLLGSVLFLVGATIVTFGVVEGQWLPRFLLGALFLAFLGLIGLHEIFSVKVQHFYRLHIALRTGETVTFASTDPGDVASLSARIGRQDCI